jgi:hypothetical protein
MAMNGHTITVPAADASDLQSVRKALSAVCITSFTRACHNAKFQPPAAFTLAEVERWDATNKIGVRDLYQRDAAGSPNEHARKQYDELFKARQQFHFFMGRGSFGWNAAAGGLAAATLLADGNSLLLATGVQPLLLSGCWHVTGAQKDAGGKVDEDNRFCPVPGSALVQIRIERSKCYYGGNEVQDTCAGGAAKKLQRSRLNAKVAPFGPEDLPTVGSTIPWHPATLIVDSPILVMSTDFTVNNMLNANPKTTHLYNTAKEQPNFIASPFVLDPESVGILVTNISERPRAKYGVALEYFGIHSSPKHNPGCSTHVVHVPVACDLCNSGRKRELAECPFYWGPMASKDVPRELGKVGDYLVYHEKGTQLLYLAVCDGHRRILTFNVQMNLDFTVEVTVSGQKFKADHLKDIPGLPLPFTEEGLGLQSPMKKPRGGTAKVGGKATSFFSEYSGTAGHCHRCNSPPAWKCTAGHEMCHFHSGTTTLDARLFEACTFSRFNHASLKHCFGRIAVSAGAGNEPGNAKYEEFIDGPADKTRFVMQRGNAEGKQMCIDYSWGGGKGRLSAKPPDLRPLL